MAAVAPSSGILIGTIPGDPFAIRPERDKGDLIAGCPGQNPQRRPRGSNCFGIFPEQCGADQVAPLVGQPLTPESRGSIEAIAPPDGIRFIKAGEAAIQDLRTGRLSILTDAQGRIETADCF
jgi:hypothetical protein